MLNEITAQSQIGFPILSTLIWLPALTAVAIMLIKNERLARSVALGAMIAVLVLSLIVIMGFQAGTADIQFAERLGWMPSVGIDYQLGVDGLSVLFIPLTALVFIAILLGAGTVKSHPRVFLINLLLLQAATLGIYTALDLILFFCFFEFALIPSFWLIKLYGMGAGRQAAATKFFIFMQAGSLPILAGFLVLGLHHAGLDADNGQLSFDWIRLLAMPTDLKMQMIVFGLLASGFAVKGPMLPLHTWMPTAVMEGPIGMGAYLLGLKVGAYGFLRFVLPLTPDASRELAWLVIGVGLFAVVYAGLVALVQLNFRRILVFASISHVGLILVAAFSMNAQAWQGALLLMLNAGIATAGLFLCAGFLFRRLGSTDISRMGGLARPLPRLATFCFIAGLALIGLPGTSGFGGELLAMSGAYQAYWVYGAIAALGVLLSASYFMWFYQRAFFGPVRNPAANRLADLDRSEMTVAAALVVIIFAVGFYPRPLTEMTDASVVAMTERLSDESARARLEAIQPPAVQVAAHLPGEIH